jgi:WD40 repeat protein
VFKRVAVFLFLAFITQSILAQGMYTSFGRNRVGSNNYQWQTMSNSLVSIYFHDNGTVVAKNALEILTSETSSVERIIGSSLSQKVIIVLYNNINELKQSNTGIVNSPINPAGYSRIRQNIFPIYFNGDYNHLKIQIRKALANAILTDLFYGGSVQEKVRSNVLISLPDWYYQGLLSFISDPWNVVIDDVMRDKVEYNSFKNFNNLNKEDQIIAGKSLWFFIDKKYGKEALANIIFWTQYERSAEQALARTTGMGMGNLLQSWRLWFRDRYSKENRLGQMPRGTESSPEKIANYKHTRFAISPNGKYLSIVTNDNGLVKVWLYNLANRSTKLLKKSGYRSEHHLNQQYYPIIAWHPFSRKIGIIDFKGGKEVLEQISINSGKSTFTNLNFYDGIRDFCYSQDGDSIIMSAFLKGQSDLYLMDLKTGKNTQLTNDYYLDINPRMHPNGDILFASRRPLVPSTQENILKVSNYPLSIFSFTSGGALKQLGKPKNGANYTNPLYYGDGLITCLTDETGVINAVVAKDNEASPFTLVSNYKRSVLYQDIAQDAGKLAELVLYKGKYYVFLSHLAEDVIGESKVFKPLMTTYRLKNPVGFDADVEPIKKRKVVIPKDSTQTKNVKDSVIQKEPYFLSNFEVKDYDINTSVTAPDLPIAVPPELSEKNIYFVNYLITQTDHSNLGYAYYLIEMDSNAMCVHPLSFNVAAEVSDIFRNYVATGGFRIHGDLAGHDAYLKFRALKHRIDFEGSVMRRMRIYVKSSNTIEKAAQAKFSVGASYPFSERSRISLALGGQQDQIVEALDYSEAINEPRTNRQMITSKLEYVFDNTVNRGVNKVYGIRAKAYAEHYQFIKEKSSLVNLGFDIRRTVPISGELVWANRLAGGISPGKFKTIYYLGGIETWILDEYNQDLGFARDPNYKFLSLAPNLRGFNRNISHGWATGVFSSELRFPIISNFYKAPIYSDFFRTFTLSSFMDIGSAWNGFNPYTSENPFNTKTFDYPNYTVSVTSPRNPWLMGTGIGVRASVLGYLLKVERAWGRLDKQWNKGITYFSIGLDF